MSAGTTEETARNRIAQIGDIVTIDLELKPEHGFVPEPLMDTCGKISFVLGWGNYLPGLHELVQGCVVGDSVQSVSIDAGYGSHDPELVVRIPKTKLSFNNEWRIGSVLHLKKGIQVVVTDIQDDAIVVDANPPLAGTSYACSFTVLDICKQPDCDDSSGPYQVATFALGCFWGAELAYMRVPGVVGTQVGYSSSSSDTKPSRHRRESVRVVYDSCIVSYQQLVQVALDRLAETASPTLLGRLFEDDDSSDDSDHYLYKHGFYYHNEAQRQVATNMLATHKNRRYGGIEVLPALSFCEAEEGHQQYLYKGGQSARKGAKDKIRCYG